MNATAGLPDVLGSSEPNAADALTRPALLAWGRSLYLEADKEPGRELFELWAHVTNSSDFLYAPPSLTPQQARHFTQLVQARVSGVPIQHLLGKMWFRGLELCAGPGCFVVRPETELLIEIAQRELEARFTLRADGASIPVQDSPILPFADSRDLLDSGFTPYIADLCSGSGAIALALAQLNPAARIFAAEISEAAAAYARRNLAAHPTLGQRICYRIADATRVSTLLESFEVTAGSFQLIATNPPYVPAGQISQAEALADPELALYGGGQDGLEIPTRLLGVAYELLSVGGVLVMEHDDAQGAALVRSAREAGFNIARTQRDLAGRDRFLVARKAG